MAVHFAESGSAGRQSAFSPVAGPSVRLVGALSACAIVAAAVVTPSQAAHGPVLCPFRLATGLPCPGCGLTRSWVDLLHGNVGAAMTANPFGIVVLVLAVTVVVRVGWAGVRRRPVPSYNEIFGTAGRATAARRRLAAFVVASWVVFAILRVVVVLAS